MAETWLKCSACRSDLAFGSKYFQCSVSTCNRARMRLVFCSVPCWDSHVATLRHRDAWAEDKIAPSKAAWERELADQPPEPVARGISVAGPVARGISVAGPPAPTMSRQATAAPVVRHAAAATPDRPPPAPPAAAAPPPASAPPPPPAAAAPPRRIVGEPAPAPVPAGPGPALHDVVDRDMMIVVSKLKKYIKDRSGMNCSDAVADVLSDHVRALCDESIRAAGRDERKTVLDRDVPRPPRR
jgi:hypothetical protein